MLQELGYKVLDAKDGVFQSKSPRRSTGGDRIICLTFDSLIIVFPCNQLNARKEVGSGLWPKI
jgi:hypothetical protein